jgi:hypothetical protein
MSLIVDPPRYQGDVCGTEYGGTTFVVFVAVAVAGEVWLMCASISLGPAMVAGSNDS